MSSSHPVRKRPRRSSSGPLLFLVLIALVVGSAAYLVPTFRSGPTAHDVPETSAPSAPPAAQDTRRAEESAGRQEEPRPKIKAHEPVPGEDSPVVAESDQTEPNGSARIDIELPPEEDRPVVTEEEKTEGGASGSPRIPAFGTRPPVEIRQGTTSGRGIALTFDAGASSLPAPSILAILRKEGVRATFFLTGKWAKQNPDLVREIVRDGHEIGNHSYSHPDFRKLTEDQMIDELEKTEAAIQEAAGVNTKRYFRPPYGVLDQRVRRAVMAAGYSIVRWSVDSWDGFKRGIKPEEIRRRVLTKSGPGAIVLMHCGSQATAEALPEIIHSLKERGYNLVPVSELQPSELQPRPGR